MTHNHFASKPDAVRGKLLSFLHNNFLGERPRVEVFGGPRKDELQAFEGKYFPIPDYGIALWLGREPETEVQCAKNVNELLVELLGQNLTVELGKHIGFQGYYATVRKHNSDPDDSWNNAGHGFSPFEALVEAEQIYRGVLDKTTHDSDDFPYDV